MNKRIFGLAILILGFLLPACTPNAPAPTATFTETSAMLSANSQVTYEPTFTITPSQTLRLTSTLYYTPTITPSPTPHPTITLPPFPTPDINFWRKPESISPTEKWVAWRVGCQNTEIKHDSCFQFVSTDGTQAWNFTTNDIVSKDERRIYGRVMNWSPDNKFVYLVTYPIDADFIFDQPAHGITKLSLVSGVVTYIITPDYIAVENEDHQFPVYYSYAFSNNGQWLAFAIKNGRSIDFTLLDLISNDVRHFSVIVAENAPYGDIVWSPNDKFFLFSVAENLIELGRSDDFSVFRVMLENLSIKRIYPHGDKFLYYFEPEWVSDSEIKYYYNGMNEESGILILNIETGEITEVDD